MKKLSEQTTLRLVETAAFAMFICLPLLVFLPENIMKWICLLVGIPCFARSLLDFIKSKTTENLRVLIAGTYLLLLGLSFWMKSTFVDFLQDMIYGLWILMMGLIFRKEYKKSGKRADQFWYLLALGIGVLLVVKTVFSIL